ncbi:nickel/cobalt transporter [Sulfitobacter guttiformis]|uniref:Nickel/cobalt efflux system n=1 Tax=Sulfitobacter guttiformis TaxID=74349 RepID=A0A420DTR2_9RHOB|nr:membrane protein [Sulfitobacter guttiformis]KIN71205.1 putative membrane protein [Sulfitobacter guttiformis KCTC 32187]RKE97676.1 ABC-type nickel/cobalt efflux system permease component RcnA [Sulfitobacter guttiformis]
MRRAITLALALACAVVASLWLSGGFDQLAGWAAGEQRDFQNGIARTLRALRGGDAGAFALLMTSCFAYGFFHAIGPGHGKLLVGGYGLARDVPVVRLSLIALLSSLGQAVTAIALAYAGLWLLGLTRERMVGTAEQWLAPLSYIMIAMIGLWLVVRGMMRLRRVQTPHEHTDPYPAHDHAHHTQANLETCGSCGHRHGPSLAEAQQATSLRDAIVLIAGIAVRPCTGALFVLIITWQMGIPVSGIAGAFAMALGTASVTIAVGIAALGFRGAVTRSIAGASALTWVMPVMEMAAGLVVVALSGALLIRVF